MKDYTYLETPDPYAPRQELQRVDLALAGIALGLFAVATLGGASWAQDFLNQPLRLVAAMGLAAGALGCLLSALCWNETADRPQIGTIAPASASARDLDIFNIHPAA